MAGAREDAEAEDNFLRGYHDIPSDAELQAMPYVALCDLLSSCQPGATRYAIIAREKERRDAGEKAKATFATNRWFERPVGIVILGVAASMVAAAVLYLISQW